MLTRILSVQLQELYTQAQEEDAARAAFIAAYPASPQWCAPVSGKRTRALADQCRSALDVAQTLELCWRSGDGRAAGQLAEYAEHLGAFEIAQEVRRRQCWEAQGAKALVPAHRKPQAPRDRFTRHIDLPEQVQASLPALPALYAKPTKAKAGRGMIETAVARLRERWGN